MNLLVDKIGDLAVVSFKNGYNCAESIVQTYKECGIINISDESMRLTSGFGGGLGKARSLCGALSGCIMVIGSLVGRINPQEKSLQDIYAISKEFHDLFEAHFKSDMCKSLMLYEFGTKEHLKTCLSLTRDAAVLLAKFLDKKELLQNIK